MSSLVIEKFKVEKVESHFNADKLDCVTITGWQLVTQKGKYNVGDEVIHIPIQTVISEELNNKLFPPDSKIKLQNDRRIRTIKLRGAISQGMIIDPKEFNLKYIQENCTKWQPPVSSLPSHMKVQVKKVKPDIKSFVKYTDMENGKYYDRCLKNGDEIVITTKLHGTSARYGWHKYEANIWYQKVRKFLRLNPEWVFCYGSRNVQLQSRLSKKNYYSENVYGKILKQYDLKDCIPMGYSVYGEIVGEGIQKGWSYGCKSGEHKFYVYDVRDNVKNQWLNYEEMVQFCSAIYVDTVPVQYVGPYTEGMISQYIDKNTLSKEINEGVVVKPLIEKLGPMGRFILKFINDEYYLQQEKIEGTEYQ